MTSSENQSSTRESEHATHDLQESADVSSGGSVMVWPPDWTVVEAGADFAARLDEAMNSGVDVDEDGPALTDTDQPDTFTAKCYPCELDWPIEVADRGEVEHLAAIHNGLHHSGRDEAFTLHTPDPEWTSTAPIAAWDVAARDVHVDTQVDVDEDGWP